MHTNKYTASERSARQHGILLGIGVSIILATCNYIFSMSFISPRFHGYVDYLSVAIFALAPSMLGMTGIGEMLSYALAIIHLVMTLTTNFPLGATSLVPLRLHGWVERIVGPVLIVIAFTSPIMADGISHFFFGLMGVVILVVGVVSNYSEGIPAQTT